MRDLEFGLGSEVVAAMASKALRSHSCRLAARQMRISHRRAADGFTLVEVLVVIAIIGILVAITLPAVEMARESARRNACANNLKQLGLAIKLHEQSHGTYPTGGWGGEWVGDPDAGFGPKQPGGWIYNILPYIEEQALRDLGKSTPAPQKQKAITKLLETPVAILNCSSRRLSRATPFTSSIPLKNATAAESVAKADYVINKRIAFTKSEVIASEIQLSTGLSKTILVGEKSVPAANYTDGKAPGDQLPMYVGDCEDVARQVAGTPVNDRQGAAGGFGSAHPGGCNFVYGDGSVRLITFEEELK